jgi:hypothetical protein
VHCDEIRPPEERAVAAEVVIRQVEELRVRSSQPANRGDVSVNAPECPARQESDAEAPAEGLVDGGIDLAGGQALCELPGVEVERPVPRRGDEDDAVNGAAYVCSQC